MPGRHDGEGSCLTSTICSPPRLFSFATPTMGFYRVYGMCRTRKAAVLRSLQGEDLTISVKNLKVKGDLVVDGQMEAIGGAVIMGDTDTDGIRLDGAVTIAGGPLTLVSPSGADLGTTLSAKGLVANEVTAVCVPFFSFSVVSP